MSSLKEPLLCWYIHACGMPPQSGVQILSYSPTTMPWLLTPLALTLPAAVRRGISTTS
ncbi:MAG: hypothetical protein HIU85_07765 [Proteobacteria bacterium]|nr:hypothetical protein [Pseudomonadota bacterium]